MPKLIARPKLPSADQLLQYVERIDRNRWYSNRGELVWQLETRLNDMLSTGHHAVITTSSGTAAIEAAILATVGKASPDRPLALMPSYTFAATALAAERCGFKPHFVDVNSASWAMDPGGVAAHSRLQDAGLILPVAPYGRMPDMRAWEKVQRDTGVQVVLDAAAAFEQIMQQPDLVSEAVPAAVSFHATKTFATGEGGGVFWLNNQGQKRVAEVTNFGIIKERECMVAGFNGKMSEYHAAVGLATLDEWPDRAASYHQVSSSYREAAKGSLRGELIVSPEISSAYALYRIDARNQRREIQRSLSASDIASRQWYCTGLHRQPYFKECSHDPLPVTGELGESLLGLPNAIDLEISEIEHLISNIAQAERAS